MAAIESGSAWGIVAITKFGWIKLLSLGAAGVGAGLMAIFRPPLSRKEMFYQGVVALGSSLLFGSFIANNLANMWHFIDMSTASIQDIVEFQVAVHGLIGATSWGIFGGLAHMRDKLYADPIAAIKEIKDL